MPASTRPSITIDLLAKAFQLLACLTITVSLAERSAAAPALQIFQGMYVGGGEHSGFIPCSDKRAMWLLDSKDATAVAELKRKSERSMAEHERALFIEFEGFTTGRKTYDYENEVVLTRLISVDLIDYDNDQCRKPSAQ